MHPIIKSANFWLAVIVRNVCVVGFLSTYTISAHHCYKCELDFHSCKMYSTIPDVIKLVTD